MWPDAEGGGWNAENINTSPQVDLHTFHFIIPFYAAFILNSDLLDRQPAIDPLHGCHRKYWHNSDPGNTHIEDMISEKRMSQTAWQRVYVGEHDELEVTQWRTDLLEQDLLYFQRFSNPSQIIAIIFVINAEMERDRRKLEKKRNAFRRWNAVGMLCTLVGMYADSGSKAEEIDTARLSLQFEHQHIKIVVKLEYLNFSKSSQDATQPTETIPGKLVTGGKEQETVRRSTGRRTRKFEQT